MNEEILEKLRNSCDDDKLISLYKDAILVLTDELNVLLTKTDDKSIIIDCYEEQILALSYGLKISLIHLKDKYGADNIDDSNLSKIEEFLSIGQETQNI